MPYVALRAHRSGAQPGMYDAQRVLRIQDALWYVGVMRATCREPADRDHAPPDWGRFAKGGDGHQRLCKRRAGLAQQERAIACGYRTRDTAEAHCDVAYTDFG